MSETEKIKKGLVLEGGAMRGMFTCGVTDVFFENDVKFDLMVGVSAGAAFGCNFKSHQPGRALRYNLKYSKDPRYSGISSLIHTGDLYNTEFCYHTIVDELDVFDREAFAADPTEFYAVACDVRTGEPVYARLETGSDEDLTWMRASASMPLVSNMVEIDGRNYLDGGICAPVPLAFAEEKGCERNVVVLTQPLSYIKKPMGMMTAMKSRHHMYPELLSALEKRHDVYNAETRHVRERAGAGKAFIICPEKPLGIKRTEKAPEELQRVYDEGRRVAEERLDALKEFLEQGKE